MITFTEEALRKRLLRFLKRALGVFFFGKLSISYRPVCLKVPISFFVCYQLTGRLTVNNALHVHTLRLLCERQVMMRPHLSNFSRG